ncbi:MAG: LuxR C-terminal-related transcriptional regulator [Caldilineaceae bacterium]
MLLATKFFIPRRCTPIISRPRLFDKLEVGLSARLTIVSATTGSGKTMAVVDWLHYLRTRLGNQAPVMAWLTLEESDNDPVRFFSYLIASLQTLMPTLGVTLQPLLESSQAPDWNGVVTTLINELHTIPSEIVLVLDDYHLIAASVIHHALIFFIEHLSPNLHLYLTTRSDPPWPLARWRVRRQMVDVRAIDLRFSRGEIESYLAQTIGKVTSAEVSALEERTEGWIAGLQLATLPLQEEEDPAAFIRSFTGSQRYVMDYLIEEVLQRQPEQLQHFLLQSSILERLCPQLCAQVCTTEGNSLSVGDAGTLLESLVRANLFLTPLDNERQWYRYHPLFADVLRARLHQLYPQQLNTLHEQASLWFGSQGLADEAIRHALLANKPEQAANIIERESEARLRLGQHITLQGWLDRLPAATVAEHPKLALLQARLHVIVHKLDGAERMLENAQQRIIMLPSAAQSALLGELAAIRASVALNRGNYPRTLSEAQLALNQLAVASTLRPEIYLHLGLASSALGKPDAALTAYAQAATESKSNGDLRTTLLALFNQGGLMHSGGQLRRAAEQYQATLDYANRHGGQQIPSTAYAYQMLGDLWIEWNDLEQAAKYLQEAKLRNEHGAQKRMLCTTYLLLARIHFAKGDLLAAQQQLNQARTIIAEDQLPIRYAGPVQGFQVRLWMAQGNLVDAQRWAAECQIQASDEPLLLIQEERYHALARVLAASGRSEEALLLLKRYSEQMSGERRVLSVISTECLHALLLWQQGEKRLAIMTLLQALRLAQPEGMIRTFVDEGSPMRLLLLECNKGADPQLQSYVNKLLSAFPLDPAMALVNAKQSTIRETVVQLAPSRPTQNIEPLIEPLSEREIEILRVVAQGLSDRQVADTLIIAIGTVKKHLNNIYGKLSVGNRTGALARARELGLL